MEGARLELPKISRQYVFPEPLSLQDVFASSFCIINHFLLEALKPPRKPVILLEGSEPSKTAPRDSGVRCVALVGAVEQLECALPGICQGNGFLLTT